MAQLIVYCSRRGEYYVSGSIQTLAETYGVQDALVTE